MYLIACRYCGHEMTTNLPSGRMVQCPVCNRKFQVPKDRAPLQEAPPARSSLAKFGCLGVLLFTTLRAGATQVAGALLGPGVVIRPKQAEYQPLTAGGAAVTVPLAYAVPPAGEVYLQLDADRAGEKGQFKFTIPAAARKP